VDLLIRKPQFSPKTKMCGYLSPNVHVYACVIAQLNVNEKLFHLMKCWARSLQVTVTSASRGAQLSCLLPTKVASAIGLLIRVREVPGSNLV
jgi:hypothetical protein